MSAFWGLANPVAILSIWQRVGFQFIFYICFVSLVVAVVVRQNVAHRVGGKAVFWIRHESNKTLFLLNLLTEVFILIPSTRWTRFGPVLPFCYALKAYMFAIKGTHRLLPRQCMLCPLRCALLSSKRKCLCSLKSHSISLRRHVVLTKLTEVN